VLNAFSKLGLRSSSFALLLVVISCTAFGRSSRQDAGFSTGGDDERPWPRVIESAAARITVYEPQLETLKGHQLRSRAAISVQASEADAPIFGGLWLEADLDIDSSRRTATPRQVKVTEIRFPSLDAARAAEWRELVASEFLGWKLTFSLDRLLSELKVHEERRAAAQALKADVPQILFRSHPALLLVIEGDAAWRDLPDTSFRRLANSAFFVVQEKDSGICFLRVSPFWWISRAASGPWEPIHDAPAVVAELWKNEPKPQLPAAEEGQDAPPRPEVVVVNQPAELIWTDGDADYAPIAGTSLLYVKNTESDVFLDVPTQLTYVLLSGRWYRSADKAAWEFVASDQLPFDFSRIPLSSEKQHVLACVVGTPQARDAVRDAAIPQTAAVKPGEALDLAVRYDGEPQFTDIQDSPVRYAVNTPYAVFGAYGRYYCCDEGIWYDSEYAIGPWLVSTWVPPAIYLIPPSCPYYYVTFCRIFSVSARAIYCGYYPGYRGCYVWGGSVVYGTGWRYHCWSGSTWIPRPLTWGCGVRYSAPSCTWTLRVGGAGTCAWLGFHRSPAWRAPTVAVGAGGAWSGVATYRGGSGSYRQANFVAPAPSNPTSSLYARQPQKVVAPQPLPVQRDPAGVAGRRSPRGFETPRAPASDPENERHPGPAGHRDAPPSPTGRRDAPPAPATPAEHPDLPRRTPPTRPAPAEHPDGPRQAPPTPAEHPDSPRKTPPTPAPRENPRAPSSDRETPKAPPPAPAPREHQESPKAPPPPPAPRERRESPPPPPAPRERRETPPPPPPPRERRESPPPRNPPPPPPPRERERDQRDNSKEPPRSPGRR
jgi:hypothetical protein